VHYTIRQDRAVRLLGARSGLAYSLRKTKVRPYPKWQICLLSIIDVFNYSEVAQVESDTLYGVMVKFYPDLNGKDPMKHPYWQAENWSKGVYCGPELPAT